MTKAEIIDAVYEKVGGFSKKESADLVDLVFETMKETLGRGEKIKISGFGNFVLRDKRQRQIADCSRRMIQASRCSFSPTGKSEAHPLGPRRPVRLNLPAAPAYSMS